MVVGATGPSLPPMTPVEASVAALWSTGVTTDHHPFALFRPELDGRGVVRAADLLTRDEGRILVAGAVTHRQRPSTAGGTVFFNLEDETGTVNVICSQGCYLRYREAAGAPTLLVRGRLQRVAEAVTVVAEHLEALELPVVLGGSRDFR
jgi:error-prone DNA polymerase